MHLTSQQLLVLTQLTDSMFPSGGFVHSDGLETYVQSGKLNTIEELENMLTTRLMYDWAHQDMVALQVSMSTYLNGDLTVIKTIDERLTAMKIVKENRLSSMRVGKQTLRTILMLIEDPLLDSYQTLIRQKELNGHQSIVFGLTCASAGITAEPALTAYAYNVLSSLISVALKLMHFGQTQAQQLLWYLQPKISQAVTTAMSLTLDDMQSFVPAIEISGMQHEYLFRRLFNS